ncbi:hypothetical protein ABZ780_13465 [Micromonospora sp. NPDC047467]|uniref:hypothetical protein n=1 Tax=Micromonospora sp. NPDC047467 TaxID=3154814 RepID=UPI0034101A03
MSGVPVITCPDCAGLAFQVRRCQCTSGGDRLIVEWDAGTDQPYADCQLCRGDGSVAVPCRPCARNGRRRAELVLTVVNLDTGLAASRQLRPGRLAPEPDPGGGWQVPLAPILRELADAAGVHGLREHWRLDGAPPYPALWLPRRWQPDLPAAERHAIEAEVLAGQDYDPWWVLLGRSSENPPPPDPGQRLSRLCALADLLHLDLVVEARRCDGEVAWDVRYEMPGGEVPAQAQLRGDDLRTAVAAATVAEAMYGLDVRGLSAPAYTVRLASDEPTVPVAIDLDLVERRVVADLATGAPGAQAIWRNRRWWHTQLHPGGGVEVLHERATGQVVRRRVTTLLRAGEPPDPTWWGEPVDWRACRDCRPDSRLRRCHCRLGRPTADPDCPRCGGAGMAPSALACHTCRDSRRIYFALTVTVTDLTRATHTLWRPSAGEPATLVATQPGGKPVYQLRDHYRAARLAANLGVRPQDLTHLDDAPGHGVGQDLCDGTVTVDGPDVEPARHYVSSAARGRPGARLIVLAQVPDAPPLVDLIRLALGLDVALAVTVCDYRLNAADPLLVHGERWRVQVVHPDAPIEPAPVLSRSLQAAVADCLEHLDNALLAVVPRDPEQPVPAPGLSVPPVVADPTALLSRLGRHYAGQLVTARFTRGGCQLHLGQRDGPLPLARAATLADAVAALRLA